MKTMISMTIVLSALYLICLSFVWRDNNIARYLCKPGNVEMYNDNVVVCSSKNEYSFQNEYWLIKK